MIIKCPKCAENFEIDAVLADQWGVCPHCQSTIRFSTARRSGNSIPFTISSDDQLKKIGWIIAAIGLLGGLICALLAGFFA